MNTADVFLLQRWMLGAHAATLVLLAFFFTLLARAQPLAEVRLWAAAWAANAAAVTASLVAPLVDSDTVTARLILAILASGKGAFAALLLAGARYHVRPGVGILFSARHLVLLLLAWGLVLAIFAPGREHLQLAQAVMVASLVGIAAWTVLTRPRVSASRWLGAAMLIEALVFVHYLPLLLPTLWGAPPIDPGHLFLFSLLETAAEGLVALASLVALQGTVTASLRHLNEELEASQTRLRHLLDVDPLTGLFNRRALRPFLVSARPSGAAVIVLDIDNFKWINDTHGHIVGDECLKLVAEVLRRCYRAEDGLFRWGGDEFLLVCPGLDQETARSRTAELTRILASGDHRCPSIHLSAGIALLPPGGEPELAIQEADALMLAGKSSARAR